MELPFRIKDSVKQRMLKFLKNTVDFYSEDVSRRSFEISDRGVITCKYKKGDKKCAIGRWISDELYSEELESQNANAKIVMKALPKPFQSLSPEFLNEVQYLHDSHNFWCEKGLTLRGKQEVQNLKKRIKSDFYAY